MRVLHVYRIYNCVHVQLFNVFVLWKFSCCLLHLIDLIILLVQIWIRIFRKKKKKKKKGRTEKKKRWRVLGIEPGTTELEGKNHNIVPHEQFLSEDKHDQLTHSTARTIVWDYTSGKLPQWWVKIYENLFRFDQIILDFQVLVLIFRSV